MHRSITRLAQLVERTAFNRVVGGSSPPSGAHTSHPFPRRKRTEDRMLASISFFCPMVNIAVEVVKPSAGDPTTAIASLLTYTSTPGGTSLMRMCTLCALVTMALSTFIRFIEIADTRIHARVAASSPSGANRQQRVIFVTSHLSGGREGGGGGGR